MKRMLCLALAVAAALGLAGCVRDKPGKVDYEMPTAANPAGTMKIDALLYAVNEVMGYGDKKEKYFSREDATSYAVPLPPDGKQTLYMMEKGDIEIRLFADIETDCFTGAYFKSLLHESSYTEQQMVSLGGAFLSVLEPTEFGRMLVEISPTEDEIDENGVAVADGVEKTASGDAWAIVYQKSIFKIEAK